MAAALARSRYFLTLAQSHRDPALHTQWERWLLRGIARGAARHPEIVAGAPRFVTGSLQEYLAEAAEYGALCQEQAEAHRPENYTACECDDEGPCSHCTVDERCETQARVMDQARYRAARFVRRWLAGEWDDVGPAEAVPATKRSA
jgi:hypothetical protein